MAANLTKAQVAEKFRQAGVQQPSGAMSPEELQRHLSRRAVSFASARGKENRSRAGARRRALKDFS